MRRLERTRGKHRGASAVNWAIIQGESQTGFSIFWPDERVDAGPVLLQRELAIELLWNYVATRGGKEL